MILFGQCPDVNTLATKTFLDKLKEFYKEYHLIIVWDNAAFHKSKKLEDENLTIIFLPSYSPELNPAERFFQEIRKVTANQIFENIEQQEKLIDQALVNYTIQKKKRYILLTIHFLLKYQGKRLKDEG